MWYYVVFDCTFCMLSKFDVHKSLKKMFSYALLKKKKKKKKKPLLSFMH
ncbi:hypothetical protein HanRHA438_Chr00c02g0843321 [Helianthus annuus]|nr:hypothetical protein HanRHA438_Chr00c02g0843321 [Helianthus annuus]